MASHVAPKRITAPTRKSPRVTVPEALNRFAARCIEDSKFRDECCRRWKRFDDARLGKEIADYAREVFPLIGASPTREQLAAIQHFPAEGLCLLRSFVVQFLSCPRPGPTPLSVRYRGIRASRASISISIDEDDNAQVTFRAREIP
jgi:hypothetical protein